MLFTLLILSRLDYCNAALAGLPQTTLRSLQRVQNAAARLVANIRQHDHTTPAMKDLHWLPVNLRISTNCAYWCTSSSHSNVQITSKNLCRWLPPVLWDLDSGLPVVSPTGKQRFEPSSVSVPSATPDLMLGTHYLNICRWPLTLTVLSVYWNSFICCPLLIIIVDYTQWQCNAGLVGISKL